MKQVGMLNLRAEYEFFADDIRSAVEAVLESQRFIGGPDVGALEEELSGRIGVAQAVAVSSGTDALLCAMMALEIGPGDEVIVPTFTFFATAGSVARVGAKPVFVDIDPHTFNLDVRGLESAITERTRAIIAVHVFGQCAEMDAIGAEARKHGLRVIEDAAQAVGAKYRDRQACALGDMACLSFYPTKNLGGFGEGGMILTDSEELAAVARQLRNHGESARYVHERVGGNFRLDTVQAAVLRVKLRFLDEFNDRRRDNAGCYNERLAGAPVQRPYVPDEQEPVYHQYSILCDRRDELAAFLRDRGVSTGVYYPTPLHLQPCFAEYGPAPGSLPVAERICTRVLSLPCHPMLSENDIHHVCACIHEFYGSTPAVCAVASEGEARETDA